MSGVVGFIGVGNMGAHMARNLIRNGCKLLVYDVNPQHVKELKESGASAADHPAHVASECASIVTMLPSSPHVKTVYCGHNGILQGLKPGTLCIDSSTIEPAVSVEVAKEVQGKRAKYVDAPVSGGVLGARDATITFMVGGDNESFLSARELLKFMGKNIVHCGKVGNGQAAKICNNMLLGISMIGVAESMNLGIRLGLDAKQLAAIINTSSGRCWSSDVYNPVPGVIDSIPPSKGYAGGFGCSLMAKDLGLAQMAATSSRSPTPLGSLAHQLYRLLANSPEYQKLDFAAIYKFLEETTQAA